MSPGSPASSSASDGVKTRRKPSSSKTKENEGDSEVEDSEAGQQNGEGGEEGGDDKWVYYEVEAILDAKREKLIKWVGYERCTWMAEDDLGNATELITAFNEKRKLESLKKAAGTKRTSKCMVDDTSDADGSLAKKRGPKSVSKKPPKKSVAFAIPEATSVEPPPDKAEGIMQEHMQAPTWDHLIKKIDGVQREADKLFVYLELHGGERIREDSKSFADKYPKMLQEFYESRLIFD
ncbi:hypothetical protein B0H12DRAFT_1242268 [Mycena haematopus]|nr:hypothetical protein B0H12DRAFT_1242268 [Mycena haematopus]